MNHDPTMSYLARPTSELFTAMVNSEQQAVFGAAWRVLGDHEAAEDVTQELFMRVLDAEWGKRDVRDGRGFLVSQAIGMARTRLRGDRRRTQREQVAAKREHVESEVVSGAVLREVRDAILELPEDPRECVELRYFGGLKVSEIATHLGCAVRTVNDRLQAARERLRLRLSAHSAAFLIPLLDAESIPPMVEPTAELSLRLDALSERALDAGLAGTSSSAMGYVLAASLILVLSVVGLYYMDGADPASAEERELVVSDSSNSDALDGMAPEVELREVRTEKRIASVTPPEAAVHAAAQTALRVLVRDESGTAIEGATLHLKARKLASLSAVLALDELDSVSQDIETLFYPITLRQESEIFASGFPRALCDLPFELCGFAPGYATPEPISITLVASETLEIELRLPRPTRAEFSLIDSETLRPVVSGRAFSSTELERRDLDPKATWALAGPGRGESDVAGLVRLEGLGAGLHQIEISAVGYHLAGLKECLPSELHEVRLVPIADTGSILVRVQDPQGEPIVDFPVLLRPVASDVESRAQTGENGVARFDDLSPGRYEASLPLMSFARLRKDRGYADSPVVCRPFTMGEKLCAGEELALTLGYLPGTARWQIDLAMANGEPVVGKQVTITGPVQLELATDRNGRCVFEHLPAGEWRLTVGDFVESFTYERPALTGGELRTERIVLGEARVEGRIVIAESGRSPQRAFVMIQGDPSVSVHAGPDGKFALTNIRRGDYELRCVVPGYAVSDDKVRVESGSKSVSVSVSLVRGGSILVDRGPDWAIHGGVLELRDAENDEFILKAVAGRPGEFRASTLLPGVYTVSLNIPGRELFTTQVVVENRTESALALD